MQEEQFKVHNRSITDNNFGDHVIINQGDVHHHHVPAPPQPWKPIRLIPYLRNKELVNRPDLVDKLNGLLPQDSESFNDAALWGLGGSGKTQIALEYAYRRCENPQCSVFWVHADTKAAFTHDYKNIAELFGLEGILDGPELELLRAVNNRIQSEPRWLLVLDNADNLSLFGVGEAQETSGNLFDFVPKGTAVGSVGTVLWTSRDGQIAGSLVRPSHRAIKVSHMTSIEARELLTISRGKDSDDDAGNDDNDEDRDIDQLLEELQWLPLAISQAGAYMRRAETTVREYLAMLSNNEERWPLLKEEQFDLHRKRDVPNSILKTWSISVARIEQENMLASEMLRVMAYFDNRDIPHGMIDDAARSISTTKLSNMDVKRAIIRLKEFSFISLRKGENGSQSYEMHKLVQEATRYAVSTIKPMEQGVNSKWDTTYFARIAVQVVDNLFPNPSEEKDGEGDKFLDMLTPGEKYFAHAIQVADWVEISNQENTVCALLCRVSAYLRSRQRWKEKESVDGRILALHLHLFGPNHLDTILCEQSIAENYDKQHRYQEAAEVAVRVFKNLRTSVGEEDFFTLRALHHVADIMCKVFQFEQAEKLQTHAINLLEKVADERVAELMAESLHCLARAYYGQKKFDKRLVVASMQVKVVEHYWRTLGENHYKTITKMQYLANLLHDLGRYSEAETLQVKVVKFFQDAIGEEHPYTLDSMILLAAIYWSQERSDESQDIKNKVLSLYSKILGRPFSLNFSSSNNLPTLFHSGGHGEYGAMQTNVFASLSNLRSLSSSPPAVAAASIDRQQLAGQPAAESTTTSEYRLFFVFSFLLPFTALILYYWINF
ncbi:uncharacterized protein TRIVIDRAFT_30879 [Trichoderma virens Gv29-8]|uniref:NB-ARC domain-containing protein n=1 Tax=Hypocrea virens (strain Gv29-8 / FGSC 10586) TaxID=413071 RepID=G9ML53_HYPVG|nr:uncharacterized protein TRIVIDRAFT_30879 [Trichoderma virens Gv29-8]EHK24947.1 hypothetical protein TRIVIDRAFT_30879 [Trichoderma virens Gv29-8]